MRAQYLIYQCLQARNQTFAFLLKNTPNAESFFNALIDYLSLGHFAIYEKLASLLAIEQQSDPEYVSNTKELLTSMTEITQAILDQYEAYETLHTEEKKILSETAQLLATRAEYEDKLLALLSASQTTLLKENA